MQSHLNFSSSTSSQHVYNTLSINKEDFPNENSTMQNADNSKNTRHQTTTIKKEIVSRRLSTNQNESSLTSLRRLEAHSGVTPSASESEPCQVYFVMKVWWPEEWEEEEEEKASDEEEEEEASNGGSRRRNAMRRAARRRRVEEGERKGDGH